MSSVSLLMYMVLIIRTAGVFKEAKALLESAATNAVGIKVNTTENGVRFTFIRDNRN